jgi:hypothetical protein
MALQWSVVILDRSGGGERQQDMVPIGGVDMEQTHFRPTTSPKPTKSPLHLTFPVDTPDLHIQELQQVWAGWRDDGTNVWSLVDPAGTPSPPFGGYILTIDGETVEGGEKVIDCTVVDYGILLTKTDIIGWPTFVQNFPSDPTTIGYPSGHTVTDWLTGDGSNGTGYAGIVRAHLGNGVQYDGVDPIFDTLLFTTTTVMPGVLDPIPGLGTIQGYFGGAETTVDTTVKAIADAALSASFAGGGVEMVIGYWMRAVIGDDPTRIVPQFNFRNVADEVTAADFTVATDSDTAAGEWQMETPHRHERDASEVRTVVSLFGMGGDPTVVGNPMVFASYQHPDHAAIYPTDYQIDPWNATPGWGGGAILETRLFTIATARRLAEVLENRAWGAKGSQECRIGRPTTAGERCRWRDTNESIDRVYIVTEADGPDEDGLYRLRVGFTQPTISDMLKGGLADSLLWREDLAWKTGALITRTMPGTGKQIPPEVQPTHPERNHVTAGYNDTPAIVLQGSVQDRDPINPVDPASYAHPFQVKPPATALVPDPAPGTYVSHADGRPHPCEFHAGVYSADGTYPLTVAVRAITLTAIDLAGTGSVTLLKDGVAVSPAISGDGHHVLATPISYVGSPVLGTPGNKIGITVAGTDSGDPLHIVPWEA